jgi:NADPH:quinone reductase-like Zn-dependent oxidoreductase
MRAIVLMGFGDVDQLELKEEPDPKPGVNEIKVRVQGAGVNPVDWKMRTGAARALMAHSPPIILGRDASGTVVDVGEGVITPKLGDRVMGLVDEAYADFVVAPANAWAIVPEELDLIDAAALPLALLTGSQLIESVMPRANDTILVTGAVGSVGRAAVFEAKRRGANVWAGVRGEQRSRAAQLDVAGVIALDEPKELDRLPMLDGIVDTVGGDTLQGLLVKVKPGGYVGSVLGEPRGAKERGLAVHSMTAHADGIRLGDLAQAVAAGKLAIPIAKKLPLAMVGEAQRLAEHGAGGKVVLTL